ncbi:MAG: hypothetical protein O2821_00750 [Chloroflexi bacterium]|nr:hypothetical protein [Chloroflexota bacterium]MDA1226623.1 hypothetical protein [Chloroflexota bacterium]
MIIRVEPKEWDMYTVQIFFSQTKPHAEDSHVRQYLTDNGLEPKRQSDVELDGENFELLSFGGCYLGAGRMEAIADIQKSVVQRELLAEEIAVMLTIGAETHSAASAMTDATLKKALGLMVEEFNKDSSFETDADGQLQVVLNAEDVHARFLGLGTGE